MFVPLQGVVSVLASVLAGTATSLLVYASRTAHNDQYAPSLVLCFVFSIACGVSFILLSTTQSSSSVPFRQHVFKLVLSSYTLGMPGLAFFLTGIMVQVSLARLPPALVVLVFQSSLVVSSAFNYFFHKARFTITQLRALGVVLVGIFAAVYSVYSTQVTSNPSFSLSSFLFGVISAFLAVVGHILGRFSFDFLTKTHSSDESVVSVWGRLLQTSLCGAVLSLVFFVLLDSIPMYLSPTSYLLTPFLPLVVIALAVSFLLPYLVPAPTESVRFPTEALSKTATILLVLAAQYVLLSVPVTFDLCLSALAVAVGITNFFDREASFEAQNPDLLVPSLESEEILLDPGKTSLETTPTQELVLPSGGSGEQEE